MVADEELIQMSVADVLGRWPQVMVIFQRHRLACCGCALADFCKIGDVAEIYEQVRLAPFVAELQAAIQEGARADRLV
jgi:hypothetical protein